MFALAKETGWSEEYIFWRLPLARANQYQHAALRSAGAWTVPPAPTATDTEGQVEALMSRWHPPSDADEQ